MTESSTSAQAPEANPPGDREPLEIARDMLAANLAAEIGEGVTVTHDVTGWQARRNGVVFCRAESGPALRALAAYMDPGPAYAPEFAGPDGDAA
jgi:hypothetical protein